MEYPPVQHSSQQQLLTYALRILLLLLSPVAGPTKGAILP